MRFPRIHSRQALCALLVIGLLQLAGCGDQSDEPTTGDGTNNHVKDKKSVKGDRQGKSGHVNSGGGSKNANHKPTIVVSTKLDAAHENDLASAYDPRHDGWNSEVFNQESGKVLHHLTQWLSDVASGNPDVDELDEVVVAQVEVYPLVPKEMETQFDDGVVVVARPTGKNLATTQQGRKAFHSAIQQLVQPWADSKTIAKFRPYLKQYRVQPDGKNWSSKVLYSAVGQNAGGLLQQNATWHCKWVVEDDKPRLLSVRVTGFEQIQKRSSTKLFSDCTKSVFKDQPSYQTQIRHGANYWVERIPQYAPDALQGAAIGDINGDGLEDVYLCQGKGLPNRLLITQPDGTVIESAKAFGVDLLDETRSALFIDLDNDGDQDMVIAAIQNVLFYENTGEQLLKERWRVSINDASSLGAADVDNDGLLDIYVGAYQNALHEIGVLANPVPYHDAQNGASNFMIKNRGDWQFIDVTKKWGLDDKNSRFSLAVSFEDYDNDGDADLYVTNDFGRNNLYQNQAKPGMDPRFVDVAAKTGVEDTSFGMSVAWGDVNRDGRMDLYISNMFSAAGNRVTYQRQFMKGSSSGHLEKMRYLARGNSLFLNQPKGPFIDISEPAGVMNSQWTWGSRFCDINNDGWLDLLATNGFLTGQQSGDL